MATVLSVVLFCSRYSCLFFFVVSGLSRPGSFFFRWHLYRQLRKFPTPFFCVSSNGFINHWLPTLSLPTVFYLMGFIFIFTRFSFVTEIVFFSSFSIFLFFYQIKKGHPPPLLVSCATFNDWAGHLFFFFLLKKIDGINPLLAIYKTLPPPGTHTEDWHCKVTFCPGTPPFILFFSSWW